MTNDLYMYIYLFFPYSLVFVGVEKEGEKKKRYACLVKVKKKAFFGREAEKRGVDWGGGGKRGEKQRELNL